MAVASDGTFSNTDHGLLVAFGEFLEQHGLLKELLQVPIPQKAGTFTPQAKLIEFLAGISSGIEYLSDLNEAPHPLARDELVAHWDGSTSPPDPAVDRLPTRPRTGRWTDGHGTDEPPRARRHHAAPWSPSLVACAHPGFFRHAS
ncbi:MAG: hypothetical protein M1132_00850 [Chloroflexi bacterium]|nr:hypothetical protein [Chloroflexota bacterium]